MAEAHGNRTHPPTPDDGFEDRMVPMPSVLYLLGSSWLSSLPWEGTMPLCHSRVTAYLQSTEEPSGKSTWPPSTSASYISLKGHPRHPRPSIGRQMPSDGPSSTNRRPGRALSAQPRKCRTSSNSPLRLCSTLQSRAQMIGDSESLMKLRVTATIYLYRYPRGE